MVIYEAISHGLPVAMYELPYLAIQEKTDCLLLAPMGDEIGLAEVIKGYVSDSEYQKRIQQSIARQNEKDSVFLTEKLWNAFFLGCENSDVQDNDLLSVQCNSMIKAIVQMYDFAPYHRHPLNEMCNGLLGICVHVKQYLLGVVART